MMGRMGLIGRMGVIFCLGGCVSFGVTPALDGRGGLTSVGGTLAVTPDLRWVMEAMGRPNPDLPKPKGTK
jgi:hypothetical protein